jgi:pyruvate dehydrogenase (quinone)
MGHAWDEALTSHIPVVLEVKTDPEVPPLPPHITMQQARNFSPALKGDPSEGRAFSDAVRQALASVLPSEK